MNAESKKPKLIVQNISCVFPQSTQTGGLFLGNMYGAQNPAILKEYGIRAVLTTSIETDIKYKVADIPFHMRIQAHDKEDYLLIDHLKQCVAFIEQARKYTNVFVHCYAGVSRSVAVVCAYIMSKFMWDYQTTYAFVLSKRIVAKPNQGFKRQLLQFQAQLFRNQTNYSAPTSNISHKQSFTNIQNKKDYNSNNYPAQIQGQALKPKTSDIRVKQQKIQKYRIPQPASYNFSHSAMNFKSPQKIPYEFNSTVNGFKNSFTIQERNHFQNRTNLDNNSNKQNKNIAHNISLKEINPLTKTSFKSNQHDPFKPQDRVLGGKKQIYNHNSIPIPKLKLGSEASKESQESKFYSTQQSFNTKKILQQIQSPKKISMRAHQMTTISPKLQNWSLYTQNTVRTGLQTKNVLSKRQSNDSSNQKNKLGSRCIIKPKDLPGYKNYV